MDTVWIIVANASHARLFSRRGNGPLEELNDVVDESTRLRAADTETDDLGRRSASKSGNNTGGSRAPSDYEPQQSPVEHRTEGFARSLATALNEGRNAHRYDGLVVVASPEFLGVLRGVLDPQVTQRIRSHLDKDYTQLSATELAERIDAHRGTG